ncbi:MAG: thioredoxin family protein [Acidobacteria bacterium]|nr:thioredoxin family protein [Acidobacteriota bacterium]
MTTLTREHLAQTMSYEEFRELMRRLVAQSRTTGPEQTPQQIDFTKLNDRRMKRLEENTELLPVLRQALAGLSTRVIWVALVEAWCGDVAQNLPVIARIAGASPRIELRILLRDDHPDIMDAYRTNGARAIPRLICLDAATLKERCTWGPRPEPAQNLAREWKAAPNQTKDEFHKKLHLWYGRDRGETLQREFVTLLNQMRVS